MPARYQRIPKEDRTLDGKVFDSKKEMLWASKFRALFAAGKITDYEEQVNFELIPADKLGRAVRYRADFVFIENDKRVVFDVKGHRTEMYKIKRRLMFMLHGIEIEEV